MGFNISEIVQGEKWRNFMKYLYAWGAALVLLGALFKLMYWPGAGTMLTIGMTTEVVIFFFSGFEPLHDEPDWTLVYPELAGMSDEEELRKYRKGSGLEGVNAEDLKEIITSVMAATGGGVAAQPITSGAEAKGAPVYVSSGSGGLVFSEKFNDMLEKAEIGPELFEKISKGLNKLSDTTTKLSDITEAASATSSYTENLKRASQSIEGFVESYQGSGQVLNESVNILSESFQKVAGTISESGQNFKGGVERSVGSLESQLTNAGKEVHDRLVQSGSEVASQMGTSANGLTTIYTQLAEAMKANGEIISSSSSEYHTQLDRLNKNMGALNAAHELHLQGTSEKLKDSQQVYAGVESMMKKLNSSIEETEKYADSVAKLNQNIASLNTVYGNMLSAMNVMSNNA